MDINLRNNIFDRQNGNHFVQNFINELSNHLKDDTSKSFDVDSKWNGITLEEDLTLYNEKITVTFRDKMLTSRANILQKYAHDTKEKGEMFYIYSVSTNHENSYNLSYCNENKSHNFLTKSFEELPKGSSLGSILRKHGKKFILDEETTKNVGKEINKMIMQTIDEQKEYLSSKRIDGHTYEVGEKYSGRIWLYDLDNVSGGGIEGFEEIEFPKDLYEKAKEGDLFIYKNGKYIEGCI